MEIKNKIEYIAVEKLKSHPDNPRLIKDEAFHKLCDSIKANKDYFETRPILCNKDMVVFAGNMRLKAAKEVGMTEVPVAVMDISEERQRELMIRDNVQNGEWNADLLAAHFETEELQNWGVDMAQFGVIDGAGDDFSLPSDDKGELEQITFTLPTAKMAELKDAVEKAQKDEAFASIDAGENKNGAAVYLIALQWKQSLTSRKLS